MLVPYHFNETTDQRHKRLFSARMKKAKNMNLRVKTFIKDIEESSLFKDSEKAQLLKQLTFLP
jgi:hypothetical protein